MAKEPPASTGARPTGPADSIEHEYILHREQAAVLLKVSTRTLDIWNRRGEGPPAIIIAGHRRYLKTSLIAWLRSREVSSAEARRVLRPRGRSSTQAAVEVAS